MNPTITTNSKINPQTGEIINPTTQDIQAYNQNYETIRQNPNVAPTIDANQIGNVSPIKIPQPQPQQNLLAGLTQNFQATADASTAKQDEATSTYENLLNQLGMESADTLAMQEQQGLPQAEKELLDLQKVANQQQARYIQGYTQAEMARNTRQETNLAQTNITRQNAIDSLLTNSLISAKQGDITYANTLIDRAIKAKYDPIKATLNAKKFILEQVNTKAAEDRKNAINLQIKQAEKQETDLLNKEKMIIEAAPFAPVDILAKAREAKTTLEAAQILGKYGGDYMKTELLKEQIKTEKAQRDNYNASAAKTRAETGLLGKPMGVDGVIATLPKSSQDRYYKLQGDFDTATKNYRAAIDSAGNISALSKDATPQQQTAIIFSYMKTLDPSSTVREGEFALVGKTAGLDDRAVNALKKLDNGARLNEKQINDIVGATKVLSDTAKKNLDATSKEYDRRAEKFGLPKGLFYEPQEMAVPQVETKPNVFSQALSTQPIVNGTSIIGGVTSDGSFNFTLPGNNSTKSW